MLKSLVKALGFALSKRKQSVGLVVGLAFSEAAFSLGMGGISVITALGEPLKADIELVAVTNAERNNLSARLAGPEMYKSAGLEYPARIPPLKFKIETRAEGGKYIRVTSSEPLNEPFVSIVVELTWPSGKLLREYTFLLDPPGFKPEVVKEAEVQPVAPTAGAAPEAGSAPAEGERGVAAEAAPVQERAPVAAAPGRKGAAAAATAPDKITVNSGDSLAKIARRVKPADISLERMLVALYRANTDAFGGGNMNRLRSGKILRMPNQAELNSLTQAGALNEIHVQAADWNAYRQKLAAASVAATAQAPKQETAGKISTTVADKTPAAKETAQEVVRLSKGVAPGEKIAAAGSASASLDKARQEEEAIARSKELQESKERIALLEKNAQAMQRLIELKSKATAKPETAKPEPAQEAAQGAEKPAAQPQESVPVVGVAGAVAASAAAPASAVEPAKPAKRVAEPVPPPSQPSLLDEILSEPLYLAGGAAGLLALGGLGIALARRRRAGTPAREAFAEVGGASGQILAPAAPSPETGDFTGGVTTAGAAKAVQQQDAVDPISEAELFLNFGRDAQAEEILKDALARNPANLAVMLKLMSIYADRKDIGAFASYAQQVKDSGDKVAWEQAADMGRKLEPDNATYGREAGAAEGVEHVVPAGVEQPASPVVDFDLGLGETPAAAGTAPAEKTGTAPQVDFDLGFEEPQADSGDMTVVMPEGLHETHPEPVEVTAVHEIEGGEAPTALDFDVTSTHPSLSVPEAEEMSAATTEPQEMMADATAIHPALAAELAGEVSPAVSGEVAKEDAYVLDFSLAEQPEAAPVQTEAGKALDFDLSSISLDLGAPAAAEAHGETRDSNWHDVATKLDLAKAYQEMGDAAGAREILEEVLREGDAQQCETAEIMLKQLPG